MMKLQSRLLFVCQLLCVAFSASANHPNATNATGHHNNATHNNATGHHNNSTHVNATGHHNNATHNNATGHHNNSTHPNATGHHASNNTGSYTNDTTQGEHTSSVHLHGVCVHNDTCHYSGKCVRVERSDKSAFNECHCSAGYKGSNCKDSCSLMCQNDGYCEPPTHHTQNLRFLSNGTVDKCICPVGFAGHICHKSVVKQPNHNDSKHTSNDVPASSSFEAPSAANSSARAGILITIFVLFVGAWMVYRRRKARAARLSSGSDNQKTVESDITYRDSECELDVDPLDDDKWNNTKELS